MPFRCSSFLASVAGQPWCLRAASLLAVPLLLLAGCESFRGTPERLPREEMLPAATDGGAVPAAPPSVTTADASIKTILASPNTDTRNMALAKRMYLIDMNFAEFESKLFQRMREAGFGTDVLTLGVTSAGAASGGAAASILSAIGAGITGSRAAFDKEVLADKTLPALHAAMRANRAKLRNRIITGMGKSIGVYPPYMAASDITDYEAAGTMLTALIGLTEQATIEARTEERKLEIITGFTTLPAANYLANYAHQPGLPLQQTKSRLEEITRMYKDLGVDTKGAAAVSLYRNPALLKETETIARSAGAADAGRIQSPA